ncbi:MAG: 2-iminoacetate synthase ThiH [Ruminococcus sp.]|nr:2-iminoacetate synthase ThiH [Ruminococcus sp.]
MEYLPGMENIGSDIMNKVWEKTAELGGEEFTEADVKAALSKEVCSPRDYMALLSAAAENFLEEMAQRAYRERLNRFGNSVYMFTPLYISNYCENGCVYCGFGCKNNIRRACLNDSEIRAEMENISATGLTEILLLTGESRKYSNVEYIGNACKIASEYFKIVGLEIYPVNSHEYEYLHECGADFVTVFQETYDPDRYEQLHPFGHKRIYPYRFNAQERALMGGMRGVGFGSLLGLGDFRKDAFAAGYHAYLLQKKYPHAEISLSCPRLRPTKADGGINAGEVSERRLLQMICAYRIFLPYAGITVSTREKAEFRDNAVKIAATKISAGVDVGIGGHSGKQQQGDGQFEISDPRNFEEIYRALREKGLQPVMHDYIYV